MMPGRSAALPCQRCEREHFDRMMAIDDDIARMGAIGITYRPKKVSE